MLTKDQRKHLRSSMADYGVPVVYRSKLLETVEQLVAEHAQPDLTNRIIARLEMACGATAMPPMLIRKEFGGINE